MPSHVITANHLKSGLVVYQTAGGGWDELIAQAEVVGDEDGLAAALERGRAGETDQKVVGVYEIEVTTDGGEIVPVRLRERIRAFGPTTHPDFARADVPEHFQHPDEVEPVRFGQASSA